MPKYTVAITRYVAARTTVVVAATSIPAAEVKALRILDLQEDPQWEIDVGSWSRSSLHIADVTELS
jgi:hypothetical protein